MKKSNIPMTVVMLAIFVLMAAVAMQFPPQARFMPLVVGIPGIVLCLLQLVLDVRGSRRPPAGAGEAGRNRFEEAEEKVSRMTGHAMQFDMAHERPAVAVDELLQEGEGRREVTLWACFIALVASVVLFGFWLTIPAFLLLFLRFAAGKTWTFSVALAAAGTGTLFLVFQKGLGVVLFGGHVTAFLLERLGGS